jgi:hypothetical protein
VAQLLEALEVQEVKVLVVSEGGATVITAQLQELLDLLLTTAVAAVADLFLVLTHSQLLQVEAVAVAHLHLEICMQLHEVAMVKQIPAAAVAVVLQVPKLI